MLVLLVVMLGGGGWAAQTLSVDAVPDVTSMQVQILTQAPGLSPIEVERTVTFPIETALNGLPGLTELRSISRPGLSVVTIIFEDGTNIWLGRQMVLERMRAVERDLPKTAESPELGPVTGALGEIFHFVIRSDHHSPMQLRTILDWEVLPKMRSVPGVIELNTMGGELKQYQVVVDPARMHAHGITLKELGQNLREANVNVGGGYLDRPNESFTLVGAGLLQNEEEISSVVLRTQADGTPLLVRHVAKVRVGQSLRYGVVTRDGQGETVMGTTLMLIGANSRDVITAVKEKVDEVQSELPPGVQIDPIYDRADFVGRTLHTVLKNLLEGVLIVTIVLAVLLGTVRGAVVVVLGIPASMSVALFAMHLFGVTGDLMSLGAIDFGFLVDGPIVILEAMMAAMAGRQLVKAARDKAYSEVAAAVVRPVGFSVAIIMLVYLPLLTLQGIEGKMFRPMAITMASALFGALLYSVVFFPALLALFVPPPKTQGPGWVIRLEKAYHALIPAAVRVRWPLLIGSAVAFVISIVLLAGAGADFIPRIDEGDLVITIRRAPSVSLDEARDLDLKTEQVLRRFPEVVTTLGMSGRAEVALDPRSASETDMVVHLRPKPEWETADNLADLATTLKDAIESEVPGTFISISQPIEDKTNELISGSRADVQIAVFGEDLLTLKRISEKIGDVVKNIKGTGDMRVQRVLGLPMISVKPDRTRLARYGVDMEDALAVVQAARVGLPVGHIYEGHRRFELRAIMPPRSSTPEALGELFVEAGNGTTIPLSEVAKIEEIEGTAEVRRTGLMRMVRVEVNLRGRDLVSWVAEAQRKVAEQVHTPGGYRVTWGGQFENFQRAKARLAMVVPMSLAIIFGMLLWMFGNARYALAVFGVVPFALVGGILGLIARGLSFSIPAAVGFIALAGVSVLNGVVMADDVKRRLDHGAHVGEAIQEGAAHTMRAVITTGSVAALGFLPMAIATGAGAEVQRPLATVVISGIALSTLLTLFVLPGVLRIVLGKSAGVQQRQSIAQRAGASSPDLASGTAE